MLCRAGYSTTCRFHFSIAPVARDSLTRVMYPSEVVATNVSYYPDLNKYVWLMYCLTDVLDSNEVSVL